MAGAALETKVEEQGMQTQALAVLQNISSTAEQTKEEGYDGVLDLVGQRKKVLKRTPITPTTSQKKSSVSRRISERIAAARSSKDLLVDQARNVAQRMKMNGTSLKDAVDKEEQINDFIQST